MRRILDSSMSSGASQSCRLSRHISFCPLSIHNSDLFQPRFLADGSFTKLSQIAFGDPPKCASKGEQFTDCLVTVLKRFMILSNTISKEGFGFSCAITMSSSLIVLISRLTRLVVLWSPTELNILLMFCSWQNSRTSLKIYPDPWSVLIVLGVPCKVKYFLRKFLTDLVDVLEFICVYRNFENWSTYTSIIVLFPKLKGMGRQSLTPFLGLVQRRMGVSRSYRILSVISLFTCFHTLETILFMDWNFSKMYRVISSYV